MIARAIDSLSERISPRVLFPNTFLTNCDFLIQFDHDDGGGEGDDNDDNPDQLGFLIQLRGSNIFWTNTSTDLYSSNHEDDNEIKLKMSFLKVVAARSLADSS